MEVEELQQPQKMKLEKKEDKKIEFKGSNLWEEDISFRLMQGKEYRESKK